jgi:murein L,D-transpeptidase YcbB/YkuD
MINEAVNTQKTISVNIQKEVFVHIFYWTAWSENGTLQFRDDLYNYNLNMLEMFN